MLFLFAGIIMLIMKYMEISPVVGWSWYVVMAPFGLAVAWWWYADASGRTKRQAMDKMDQRKQDRLDKQREAMGIGPKRRK
jgi:small Trp-rich protein